MSFYWLSDRKTRVQKRSPSHRGAKREGNEAMKIVPKKTVQDIIKEHYTRQDQRNYKGKPCLLMEVWTTYEMGTEIPGDGETCIDLEQRPVN